MLYNKLCYVRVRFKVRTVREMVWGAPLAVIGLSSLSKAWLFLDFKNLLVKLLGDINSKYKKIEILYVIL